MLDERNELLAKLMATEDINVYQNNVPTAYFDVKKRELVLPNWKNLSNIETEMLIGHEIGHALYTPHDAWVAAVESFDGNKEVFKHVMNVIEDPRIERGVKKKYPGKDIQMIHFASTNEAFLSVMGGHTDATFEFLGDAKAKATADMKHARNRQAIGQTLQPIQSRLPILITVFDGTVQLLQIKSRLSHGLV